MCRTRIFCSGRGAVTCQSPKKSCACASLVFLAEITFLTVHYSGILSLWLQKGRTTKTYFLCTKWIAVSNVLLRIVENAIPLKPEINLNNIPQLTSSCSRIPCLPFRNTKWSMLRRKIITAYFENHTKQINRAGKVQGFLTSTAGGTHIEFMPTHCVTWLYILNTELYCYNSRSILKPTHYHLVSHFNTCPNVFIHTCATLKTHILTLFLWSQKEQQQSIWISSSSSISVLVSIGRHPQNYQATGKHFNNTLPCRRTRFKISDA